MLHSWGTPPVNRSGFRGILTHPEHEPKTLSGFIALSLWHGQQTHPPLRHAAEAATATGRRARQRHCRSSWVSGPSPRVLLGDACDFRQHTSQLLEPKGRESFPQEIRGHCDTPLSYLDPFLEHTKPTLRACCSFVMGSVLEGGVLGLLNLQSHSKQ